VECGLLNSGNEQSIMEIYLAKPGGQKKGPFTLEEINRDLAASKYRDDEYWAWHEGLPQWMPLHMVPGVSGTTAAALSATAVSNSGKVPPSRPAPEVKTRTASTVSVPVPTPVEKEVAEVAAPVESVVESVAAVNGESASAFPFPALDQIFIFTSGEGRAVFDSPAVVEQLQEATGAELATIRETVQVDVIGRANLGRETPAEGGIPAKAWRAMTAIRPEVAQKAKDDFYQICVRPFAGESQESIAVLLLYNKEKLACAAA